MAYCKRDASFVNNGLSSAKDIKKITIAKKGSSTRVIYNNKNNKVKSSSLSSFMDFHSHKSMTENTLLEYAASKYANGNAFFVQLIGCINGDSMIKVKHHLLAANNIKVSTLKVTQGCDSSIAAHKDTPSWAPTILLGPINFDYITQTAKQKGGQLILMEGCIGITYSPRDIVLMNTSALYTVTRLGHIGKSQGPELTRYSVVVSATLVYLLPVCTFFL